MAGVSVGEEKRMSAVGGARDADPEEGDERCCWCAEEEDDPVEDVGERGSVLGGATVFDEDDDGPEGALLLLR